MDFIRIERVIGGTLRAQLKTQLISRYVLNFVLTFLRGVKLPFIGVKLVL